jgi:HlyD family secretion protein
MKRALDVLRRAPGVAREAVKLSAFLRARPRLLALVLFSGAALVLMGMAVLGRSAAQNPLVATVRRGTLVARLSAAGLLKPAQSITYRSPLGGREAEIVLLVPEGTLVNEGDLLVRLDATELTRELERAVQEVRQAQLEAQVAEAERADGLAAVDSLDEGEGALTVEESRAHLSLAERKVARLREAYEANKPLMERGFLTRDELDKSAFELEQAEAELALARRKAQVYIERTHPRDRQRARLLLSQKEAQEQNARARLAEVRARLKALREDIENCSIYARAAGLVVHEENLGAAPRRKIRTGDRVTGSQGLVTIPEVKRMLVEASVQEADVHRLHVGQQAVIRLDAFPDLRLAGKVAGVGTLARASAERPFEEKRFDLIVEVGPATADLRPEMTARVDVLVSERRDVLLVPVNAVFERQGIPVCHVLRAFGTETRQVELGETDDVLAEVRAGLRAGDRVSLTEVAGGQPAARLASPLPAKAPFLRTLEQQDPPIAPR